MELVKKSVFLFVDIMIMITVITCLLLVELGYVPQFKSIGFYCDDPKINFRYTGDTVSSCALLVVTVVIPYVTMVIVEWLMNRIRRYPRISNREPTWLSISNIWYIRYIVGFFFVFLVTDLFKLLIGEPRPHFLDTCRPREANNCTTGQYISDYKCTHTNDRSMRDSIVSFPSGHASFSVYTSIFLVWYLQKRLVLPWSYTLTLLCQLICVFWAILASTSRIVDRRHHWWDVLAGSILGSVVAIYNLSVSNCCKQECFQPPKFAESSTSINNVNSKHVNSNGKLFSSSVAVNNESLMQNKTRLIC